jgi:hypothetical protein
MPELPENGVYGPARGHRPRSAAGEYPRPTASLLSETNVRYVSVSGTTVKDVVAAFMTRDPLTMNAESIVLAEVPATA